ncbi:MAG: YihY/virulence factor BrkB family protein [Actinomycetota bacterium]
MTSTTTLRTRLMANFREIRRRIAAHNLMVSSAGIAFYGILALVPTLVALVSIYGLVTDPEQISEQVTEYAGSLDEGTQDLLEDQLLDIVGAEETESEVTADDGIAGTVGRVAGLAFGILLALFAASGAVQKLIQTVAVAYETVDGRAGWKRRLMAYGFTTAAIIGVCVIGFLLGVLPAILDRVDLGGVEGLINVLQLPVLALLFAGALTVLYRYGPDRSPRTPWRNPGAIVGTLLFIFFAIALSIYTSRIGDMPASYGVLGSIAVLMIFLQLTALAVIVGAEVNALVEMGALPDEATAATPRTAVTTAPARGHGAGRTAGEAAGGGALVPAARNGDGAAADDGGPLPFGKALAGLAALAALARAATRE